MSDRLTIYIYGGDWDLEEEMQQRSTARSYEDATTLTGGTGALVPTFGSTTAIHATLSGSLTARVADTNSYFLTLQGEDIAAQLLAFWKQTIYKYVAFSNDYQRWQPVLVEKYRQ